MQDFNRGTVRANQVTFEHLTQGDEPLALYMHSFPRLALRLPLPAPGEPDAIGVVIGGDGLVLTG